MSKIRVLALGDVVGRPGRNAISKLLPSLRATHQADLVIVNAENASGGLGIDPRSAGELRSAGADVLTLGDHAWQRREGRQFIHTEQGWVVRPANYPSGTPGAGFAKLELPGGIRIGVVNVIGRVFIELPLDCPFRTVERLIENELADCTIKILDMHAEATSEKEAIARFLDGRVSLVFGTHTHVPTADERILPKSTAFVSDLGMCGCLDGVIGMDATVAIDRFLTGLPRAYEVAEGPGVLQGIVCEIDGETGRAESIERVRAALS